MGMPAFELKRKSSEHGPHVGKNHTCGIFLCPENWAPSAAFRIRVLDILQGLGYRTILAFATSAIDFCFLTVRLPAISCNVGSWGTGLPFSGDVLSRFQIRPGRLAEVGGLHFCHKTALPVRR